MCETLLNEHLYETWFLRTSNNFAEYFECRVKYEITTCEKYSIEIVFTSLYLFEEIKPHFCILKIVLLSVVSTLTYIILQCSKVFGI